MATGPPDRSLTEAERELRVLEEMWMLGYRAAQRDALRVMRGDCLGTHERPRAKSNLSRRCRRSKGLRLLVRLFGAQLPE